MGEWGSVSYVHTARRSRVATAVAELLAREGYTYVGSRGAAGDGESRGGARHLTLALLRSHGPWTALQASDADFFCRRRGGAQRCRLAELTKALGRYAFHVSVHGGDSVTLLEASRGGRVRVSGGALATKPSHFHEEPIARRHRMMPAFKLLPVSDELRELAGAWEGLAALLIPEVDPAMVANNLLFRIPGYAPAHPDHARVLAFARPVAAGAPRQRSRGSRGGGPETGA